ncbi:phage holin family protein [Sporolactobacillus shoreae]|uniref:phage holin family protein n=1 Tax=Sporolactobacillus shoreae TaxID=1465501 RepID=UPI0014331394|nr:phage holin family protein [Sporolactobacillus shoreae]
MGNHSNLFIGVLSVVCAWVINKAAYFIGGIDNLVIGLVVFMGIDYATGLIYAGSIHDLASRKSLRGIRKKVGMLLLVAAGYWLDVVLGDQSSEVMRNLIIMMLVATEGISIVENLIKLGVDVPDVFKGMLETFDVKHVGEDKEAAKNGRRTHTGHRK